MFQFVNESFFVALAVVNIKDLVLIRKKVSASHLLMEDVLEMAITLRV